MAFGFSGIGRRQEVIGLGRSRSGSTCMFCIMMDERHRFSYHILVYDMASPRSCNHIADLEIVFSFSCVSHDSHPDIRVYLPSSMSIILGEKLG